MNKSNFTPSVNLERDHERDIDYLVSPNSRASFQKILTNYEKGVRAFSVIGAYGSGKSSFLWAIEKTLNWDGDYFNIFGDFEYLEGVESIIIVGNYSSFQEAFAEALHLDKNSTQKGIFDALEKRHKQAKDKGKGLLILTDEFGKFLEYAAKEAADAELYFIQLLAEFVCNTQYSMFWVNTLHQDFSAYSFGLSRAQQNEWVKVKGRFIEVPFNEPVEQLLLLAAERLASRQKAPVDLTSVKKVFNLIKEANAFPLRDFFNEKIAAQLFPLDILAASIITKALQLYGQNERSLFSFIATDDYLGLKDFESNGEFYNLANVYDYLKHNYSLLRSRHNPHYSQWAAIQTALERAEAVLDEKFTSAAFLLKTIGLLNIFASKGAQLDETFYTEYLNTTAKIDNGTELLELLEQHKIIRFQRYKKCFVLFEGTDLDIDLEIEQATAKINKNFNLLKELKASFNLSLELAKAVFFEFGTPRFFEYKLSEEPIQDYKGSKEIDGCINLVFAEKLTKKAFLSASATAKHEPILHAYFKRTAEIKSLLIEIKKIEYVKHNHPDDKVAQKELIKLLANQKEILNQQLYNAFYKGSKEVLWAFQGKEIQLKNSRTLNKQLSLVCETIYHATPIYKNEMINKSKLSSSMIRAQKNLMRAYTSELKDQNLGFAPQRTPPEKTIYLSLLKETGILEWKENQHIFQTPTDQSFHKLWTASDDFLETTKAAGRTVYEYIELLSQRPFKLKEGFIKFWVPLYLYAKRNEFALFEGEVYIPTITNEVLEVLIKNPKRYSIKAFKVDGPKLELFQRYRNLIGQKGRQELTNKSFIETVKPFLIFYKGLPVYSKTTKRLSNEALAIRQAIAEAKDPEKVFFEDFPMALNFNDNQLKTDQDLDLYIDRLQDAIKEIRRAYDQLLNRFELYITELLGQTVVDFTTYKDALNTRFKAVKTALLNQKHKVFLQRLRSDLDRGDWLNSIAQACVGSTLEKIKDQDEPRLYEKFKELVSQLDNLNELSTVEDTLGEDEELFAFELHSLGNESKKKTIRYPKKRQAEINQQKQQIQLLLQSTDKELNIATLTQILKELLEHD